MKRMRALTPPFIRGIIPSLTENIAGPLADGPDQVASKEYTHG